MNKYFSSKTFYLICVLWLLVVWGEYFVEAFYMGLANVWTFEISGVTGFVTGICTLVVLFVYPVRLWLVSLIKDAKNKRRKNEKKRVKKEEKHSEDEEEE